MQHISPLAEPLLHLDGSRAYELRIVELRHEVRSAESIARKLTLERTLKRVQANYRRAFSRAARG